MEDSDTTLLILADSYLSLARWRYGERWPDDVKREVDDLIIKIRKRTG